MASTLPALDPSTLLEVPAELSASFPSPSSSFIPPPDSESIQREYTRDSDPNLTPKFDGVASLDGGQILRPRPTSTSPPYSKLTDDAIRAKYFSTPSPPTPVVVATQAQMPRSSVSGRLSLSSNRPAPPSPTPSRHPSLRASSTAGRSRPASSALSIASSSASGYPRTKSKLQSSEIGEQRTRPRKTSIIIKIRDFGFPSHDERHLGTIRTSIANASASRNSRSSGSSGRGWSGFAARFGFGSFGGGNGTDKPRRSGSLSRRSSRSRNSASSAASSKSGARLDDSSADELYYDSQEFSDSPSPFPPGIYRALYAFEPEGPAEMALEEDQLVTALGRGGGDGWVIVLAGDNTGGQALVPEGYLELVTAHELTADGEQISRSGTPKA